MSWEQITAIASVGSACILAVASAAAIVQLRHARNANRLTAYLMLFEQGNSPDMIAARLHLANMQLSEPGAIERAHSLQCRHEPGPLMQPTVNAAPA